MSLPLIVGFEQSNTIIFHRCYIIRIFHSILETENPNTYHIKHDDQLLITYYAGYTQSDSSLMLMPVTVIPIYDSKACPRRKRRKFVILESWLTQTEQKRTALNGGFVESSRGGPPLISFPPPSPFLPQRINVHLADLFAVEPRSLEFDRRKNLARGARVKNK